MYASAFRPVAPCLLVLLLLPATAVGVVQDWVLRYVNDDIITAHDLRRRRRELVESYLRAGGELTHRPEERAAFLQRSLDELTAEALLLQEADRLGVMVDVSEIDRWVRLESRRLGINRTLTAQARLREERLREQRIKAVMREYSRRMSQVSPRELYRVYQERRESYRRPTRAHVWRILLRPATEAERQAVLDGLLAVFRAAKGAEHQVLADLDFAACRDDYLAAEDADKPAVLRAFLDRVVVAIGDPPPEELARLAAEAAMVLEHSRQLRSRAEAEEMLTELREEINAADEGAGRLRAFQRLSRTHSQGTKAAQGGDQGMVEPLVLGTDVAEVVADLPLHTASAPFWAGEVACLVLVSEREPGGERGFSEVAAEIEAELSRQRLVEVRTELVEQLRTKAYIRDLTPAEKVDDQVEATDFSADADDATLETDPALAP